MKVYFAVLLLAVAVSCRSVKEEEREKCSAEVSAACPAVDPTFAVITVNPDDCRSFCECYLGTAYKISCPGDLLFDDTLKTCNWPYNVDCEDRPLTSPSA